MTDPFASTSHWLAKLQLAYAFINGSTRPVLRKHEGPLRVQKHLYEEGPEVCQHIIVHPPNGIAGKDLLSINVQVQENAFVLLTSPGAAKWYRSQYQAYQNLICIVENEAVLEWLPQETIIFDGAYPLIKNHIHLKGNGKLFYWDIVALSRKSNQEKFDHGCFEAELQIDRNGSLIWYERQIIKGGDQLLSSPIGLNGYSAFGTFIMTGTLPPEILQQCRATEVTGTYGGITQFNGLIIMRCLSDQTLLIRKWFIMIWEIIRPVLLGRPACSPRIWNY